MAGKEQPDRLYALEIFGQDEVRGGLVETGLQGLGGTRSMNLYRVGPADDAYALRYARRVRQRADFGAGSLDTIDVGALPLIDPLVDGDLPPAQPWVRDVAASSILEGSATVLDTSVSTAGGQELRAAWYRSGYEPTALFDGITTNAWVEGADGPGIGEWVEFELIEGFRGVTFRNGIQMYPMYADFRRPTRIDWGDRARGLDYYEPIFGDNNRVRRLRIERLDGRGSKTIDLGDSRGAQEWEDLYFAPGRYRMTIESVYPGRRWDDTCLGEVTFGEHIGGMLGERAWLYRAMEEIGLLDLSLAGELTPGQP